MYSRKLLAVAILLTVVQAPAWAARYDIKQMTPEVQQALDNRKARYDEIQALKSAGRIGEDNRGYVRALNEPETAVPAVAAENNDRQAIYSAIVNQNGLGPEGMRQVEAVFGEVQREKTRPGDFIQLPSGGWVRK